jgi:hypothetical protein
MRERKRKKERERNKEGQREEDNEKRGRVAKINKYILKGLT